MLFFLGMRDGVVSIVTRLCPWRPVLQNVGTGCGSLLVSCLVDTRVLSPGIKRLGREADYSPTSNAEVKNAWSCCISAVPVCLLVVDSTSFFAHFFCKADYRERGGLRNKNWGAEFDCTLGNTRRCECFITASFLVKSRNRVFIEQLVRSSR
jgi:hypothetical protein